MSHLVVLFPVFWQWIPPVMCSRSCEKTRRGVCDADDVINAVPRRSDSWWDLEAAGGNGAERSQILVRVTDVIKGARVEWDFSFPCWEKWVRFGDVDLSLCEPGRWVARMSPQLSALCSIHAPENRSRFQKPFYLCLKPTGTIAFSINETGQKEFATAVGVQQQFSIDLSVRDKRVPRTRRLSEQNRSLDGLHGFSESVCKWQFFSLDYKNFHQPPQKAGMRQKLSRTESLLSNVSLWLWTFREQNWGFLTEFDPKVNASFLTFLRQPDKVSSGNMKVNICVSVITCQTLLGCLDNNHSTRVIYALKLARVFSSDKFGDVRVSSTKLTRLCPLYQVVCCI